MSHRKLFGKLLNCLILLAKKTLRHPRRDEQQRMLFTQRMSRYRSINKPIIYIDESGFSNDMPRTHGYSYKGERCYGTHDWQAKGRINVIGALLGKNLLCTALFQGNINSNVFHA